MRWFIILMAALATALTVSCKSQTCVVAHSATLVGLEATYLQQTQTPIGRLGYARSELAVVPTNRTADDQPKSGMGGGAKDSPNALMEFTFGGLFDFEGRGIYSRMAVGDLAVSQPGAVAMFARNEDGSINAEAIRALSGIEAPSREVLDARKWLVSKYKDAKADERAAIVKSLIKRGWATWADFIDDSKPDVSKIEAVVREVRDGR